MGHRVGYPQVAKFETAADAAGVQRDEGELPEIGIKLESTAIVCGIIVGIATLVDKLEFVSPVLFALNGSEEEHGDATSHLIEAYRNEGRRGRRRIQGHQRYIVVREEGL